MRAYFKDEESKQKCIQYNMRIVASKLKELSEKNFATNSNGINCISFYNVQEALKEIEKETKVLQQAMQIDVETALDEKDAFIVNNFICYADYTIRK